MAGDYEPMEHSLPDKAEVLGVMERTGAPLDATMGRLFLFWRLVSRETEDGFLPHVGAKGLAIRCGGDAAFWEALAAVDWVVFEDGGARMPKFDAKCSRTAKTRMKHARNTAILRGKRSGRARGSHNSRTPRARDGNPVSTPTPESQSDKGACAPLDPLVVDPLCVLTSENTNGTIQLAHAPWAEQSRFVKRACKLAEDGWLAKTWVYDAMAAVKELNPRNPVAYFRTVLTERAAEGGLDLKDVLARHKS